MISSENRKYVVYKTVCKITGKIYVGKDTKNNPAYLGSGTILRHALRASKSGGFRCKKGVLNPMWGKKHSLNSRKKFSEAKKGIYDGAKNPKAKITYQYDKSLRFLNEWKCAKDCVDFYANLGIKISRGNLSSSAKFNTQNCTQFKTVKNFIFSFSPLQKRNYE